ncbi:MAG: ABC transporter permease [Nitrososphaerales archaeon]
MRRYLALARLEIGGIRSQKIMVLAVFVQLVMLLASSSLTAGFSSAFGGDLRVVEGKSVVVDGVGDVADRLSELLKSKGLVVVPSDYLGKIGSVDVQITVFSGRLDRDEPIEIDVSLPQSTYTPALLRILRSSLEELQEDARRMRGGLDVVDPPPRVVLSDSAAFNAMEKQIIFETTYMMMLPIVLLLPLIISGGLVLDSISEEKERKTLHLLQATPLSLFEIIGVKMIFYMLVGLTQAGVWMALLQIISVELNNIGWTILLLASLSIFFVLIGGLLSLKMPNKAMAQLAYTLLSTLLILAWFVLPGSPMSIIVALAVKSHVISYIATAAMLLITIPTVFYVILVSSRRIN